ncbi:MAG: dTDP-4-dehydrorhamnose reductase [Alistipes sp.]|nr:dTDP-4-dehydrorhamnose reductase [Alistipes sp.]
MGSGSISGNILVTGAAGQLGRSLLKTAPSFPDLRLIFPNEKQADILDRNAITALVRQNDIRGLINCAAYTAVDLAEDEPETAYLINATGPAILAGICREQNIPLIHFSTDYVFDGKATEPYTEDSPANPAGVYGKTKLAGEQVLRASGCDAMVVRTSWLYSEYGNNFVLTMLRLAREGKRLRVVNDQRGTPTYATDLARAALQILSKGFTGYNTLHFSALGDTTWYGFAEEIFRQAGIKADLSPVDTAGYPVKAPRPAYSIMSMDKARSMGLPLRHWQDALGECLSNIEL